MGTDFAGTGTEAQDRGLVKRRVWRSQTKVWLRRESVRGDQMRKDKQKAPGPGKMLPATVAPCGASSRPSGGYCWYAE